MKKYFRHFAGLFIVIAVLFVVYIAGCIVAKTGVTDNKRTNTQCTETERVFDYADVLTDEEEDKLRALIAEKEDEIACDIVLVTINDSSIASDRDMMNYADDFYDERKYGYNAACGDGALYLDNWANGYCWFSTCGKVEYEYSSAGIDNLISYICDVINDDPYEGYVRYVNSLSDTMAEETIKQMPLEDILLFAGLVTIIYVIVGVIHNKGKKTTTATTYVSGGRPIFRDKRDEFLNKHITTRHIQRNNGGGGGGGGHHVSSHGVSHGGGGGRH